MASEKITAMIEEVKSLTVLELNELVKALEEEFGVSAAAMAAPAAGGAAAGAAAVVKGKNLSGKCLQKRRKGSSETGRAGGRASGPRMCDGGLTPGSGAFSGKMW